MNDRKLPSPIYAAAGAGEVGFEQLKKLGDKVDELRDRAKRGEITERADYVRHTVTENVKQSVGQLRELDADRVKEFASDAAHTLSVKARDAADAATETYSDLVRRGEHVVAGERSPIKVMATIAAGEAKPADSNGKGETKQAETAEAAPAQHTGAAEKPAAKRAPAKKTTAKKTSTAKKSTAAKKTTARQTPAKQTATGKRTATS